jgi:two-component system response regulator (stage 0 sporulation protein F)
MANLSLLVVDDEEGIVDFTKRIYARKGFSTFGATDGIVAVEIFKQERPLITLIDVHMPYSPIDGIEVLKRIKEIDKNARCIMVTRIAENYEVERAKELGAAAYLLKPIELEDLDKVIAEVAQLDFERKE